MRSESGKSVETGCNVEQNSNTDSNTKTLPVDVNACNINNDTLRWTSQLSDPTAEAERIRLYKLNRLKRYEAALKLPAGMISTTN